ncbi:hypothetical protein FUAX_28400 [Fulvitalea axinellae]|uniref:Uncharacterized protein n=1 Tax=Fulvitalea axinellae TaxID=1182444 RepID=A0AAU9CJT5_9BACT|nr:hypothetical protein FUAX_28400 [Fulvitalea axinellae]
MNIVHDKKVSAERTKAHPALCKMYPGISSLRVYLHTQISYTLGYSK